MENKNFWNIWGTLEKNSHIWRLDVVVPKLVKRDE
jgi:hypothetical protein